MTEKGTVFFDRDAWKNLSLTIEILNPSQTFILVDEHTEPHCLPYFLEKINNSFLSTTIRIPSGEEHKNIDTCIYVWEYLAKKNADRSSLIINLGGGMVTDLGGFIAATYNRGIPFINIPTSLLAMVDASVGGKTGIDLHHIKNQIGTITLPEMVVVDIQFLKTLPEQQLLSGYAEMIKHSIIDGETSWNKLQQTSVSEISTQKHLIQDSIQIKQKVVQEDPTEKGRRKVLNFGHTLGHAIESHFLGLNSKTSLLHGEAIAIGMILACYISNQMCGLDSGKLEAVSTYILSLFPKRDFSDIDIKNIIELMSYDKKNRNGQVLFVLLKDFGDFKTECTVGNELITKAFKFYRTF